MKYLELIHIDENIDMLKVKIVMEKIRYCINLKTSNKID